MGPRRRPARIEGVAHTTSLGPRLTLQFSGNWPPPSSRGPRPLVGLYLAACPHRSRSRAALPFPEQVASVSRLSRGHLAWILTASSGACAAGDPKPQTGKTRSPCLENDLSLPHNQLMARRVPGWLLVVLALPVYLLWHVAKHANTRQGWPAKSATFILFMPLIVICNVIWGFLWALALHLLRQAVDA
jgi:hypothetical protein